MRKSLTMMVAMFTILAFAFAVPMVSASVETGVGQTRIVTFVDQYQTTNTTVAVPVAINNETELVYAFTVTDESNTTMNYTFYVSIMSNGTYYNGTVDMVSVANGSAIGYVNYTALSLPLNNTANITIEMQYTDNSTQADIWYGTVNIMGENEFTMGVTLTSMIVNLMSFVIVAIFMLYIVRVLKDAVGTPSKKGKK